MFQTGAAVQVDTVEDGLNRFPLLQQDTQEIYISRHMVDIPLAKDRFKTIVQSLKNTRTFIA